MLELVGNDTLFVILSYLGPEILFIFYLFFHYRVGGHLEKRHFKKCSRHFPFTLVLLAKFIEKPTFRANGHETPKYDPTTARKIVADWFQNGQW